MNTTVCLASLLVASMGSASGVVVSGNGTMYGRLDYPAHAFKRTTMTRQSVAPGCLELRDACAGNSLKCCTYSGNNNDPNNILCSTKTGRCCATDRVSCNYDQDCCSGKCYRTSNGNGNLLLCR